MGWGWGLFLRAMEGQRVLNYDLNGEESLYRSEDQRQRSELGDHEGVYPCIDAVALLQHHLLELPVGLVPLFHE